MSIVCAILCTHSPSAATSVLSCRLNTPPRFVTLSNAKSLCLYFVSCSPKSLDYIVSVPIKFASSVSS